MVRGTNIAHTIPLYQRYDSYARENVMFPNHTDTVKFKVIVKGTFALNKPFTFIELLFLVLQTDWHIHRTALILLKMYQ